MEPNGPADLWPGGKVALPPDTLVQLVLPSTFFRVAAAVGSRGKFLADGVSRVERGAVGPFGKQYHVSKSAVR